jgi:hypothetical protein
MEQRLIIALALLRRELVSALVELCGHFARFGRWTANGYQSLGDVIYIHKKKTRMSRRPIRVRKADRAT